MDKGDHMAEIICARHCGYGRLSAAYLLCCQRACL